MILPKNENIVSTSIKVMKIHCIILQLISIDLHLNPLGVCYGCGSRSMWQQEPMETPDLVDEDPNQISER